jgi:hypothetical protein
MGNPRPPKYIFMLGDHISTAANPWQECTALNCENQQKFDPKIPFNLELGSGAMVHPGSLVPLKCMFMLGDHISTTADPCRECLDLNCENW